jgi:hypothetical protein
MDSIPCHFLGRTEIYHEKLWLRWLVTFRKSKEVLVSRMFEGSVIPPLRFEAHF